MLLKRKAAAVLTAVVVGAVSLLGGHTALAQSGNVGGNQMFDIVIDGSTADTAQNSVWRGFGYISANNSSRLLLDYKALSPERYYEILNMLFDPDGAVKMHHIKLEMGADINSSSGTEPSVMRGEDEPADVTRGAGFQLAADAKAINPDITLELLSWGAPAFVKNAEDKQEQYRLRYLWFKQTLDAAYETYGLQFDYIDPNYNERLPDIAWIKYFSDSLKSEKDTPYPYDKIKIVAADEDAAYNIGTRMIADEELKNAVDVIGIHYTSTSDENTLKCKNEYGKELWYSEGLPPASVEKYAVNADGSGLAGVNSVLDVAGRIINMYPGGGYTMYEFQPPVAAYYSGANYYPKQLITANEPWSGYAEAGAGIELCAHFSYFSDIGWQFVKSGCFGDGREENHVLYDTTNNYMTLCDPQTGDYSVILANNTAYSRSYNFTVKNLDKASAQVQIWETRGPDEGQEYDANYLSNIMSVEPQSTDNGYTYSFTVKPYSMVTVTTLDKTRPVTRFDGNGNNLPQQRLPLPYSDDFEYTDMDESFLSSRGYAPLYTTDIGGAFEVVQTDDGNVLQQKISNDMRGVEWGVTPLPVTTFGDDCWANYTVSAKVKLDNSQRENAEHNADENYAGIGLRYINSSAAGSKSGYAVTLSESGKWQLTRMGETLAEGNVKNTGSKTFDPDKWHELSITAMGDNLSAAIDGIQVAALTLSGEVTFSGRAALYSSYDLNCFDDIAVLPTDMTAYVTRVDNLDSAVSYEGEWLHNTMDQYTCHNRTTSSADGQGGFAFSFEGDSLALIGKASDDAAISVSIDGIPAAENESVKALTAKSAFWHRYSLGYGEHDVTVTVDSGSVTLDAIEYGSDTVLKDGDPSLGYLSDESADPQAADKPNKPNQMRSRLFEKTALCTLAVLSAAVVILAVRKRKKRSG